MQVGCFKYPLLVLQSFGANHEPVCTCSFISCWRGSWMKEILTVAFPSWVDPWVFWVQQDPSFSFHEWFVYFSVMFSVISDATYLESSCSWRNAFLDILPGVVRNSESNTYGAVLHSIWKKRSHMWNCAFRVQTVGIDVWRAQRKVESWSAAEIPHVSMLTSLIPVLYNLAWFAISLRAIRFHRIIKSY